MSKYKIPRLSKSGAENFYKWNVRILAAQKYLLKRGVNLTDHELRETKLLIKNLRQKCKDQNSVYRLKRKVN